MAHTHTPAHGPAPSPDDVALLVHDLRNPLAGVSAALQLLGMELDAEERTAVLAEATWAADRLGRMITDLLLLRAAAQGALVPEPTGVAEGPHLLAPVVEAAVRLASVGARLEGVTVSLASDPACRATGDLPLLRHVVEHLLVLAVQQAPPGSAVRVALSPDADGSRLAITVPPGVGATAWRGALAAPAPTGWPARAWRGDVAGGVAMARLLVRAVRGALRDATDAEGALTVELTFLAGDHARAA